ncbi:MAG TPA: acyltransferase family protein [Candidatus Dormibacteraeota bacterium]|nr:acyltransferase family protein [Candidatus Dormibacteraeota bacterium]
MSSPSGLSGTKREHLHWVDWLKVLAVAGVFYYHSAMIFVLAPWMITNRDRSLVLTAIAGLGFFFGMPLLFLLSGSASVFAMRSRSIAEFVRLRFVRLMIPLVVGLALLSPLQAYFVAASKGYGEPVWQYYPQFFATIKVFWDPRWFGAYGYHLWFLAFLFLYSLLALPIFIAVRRPVGRRVLGKLADFCEHPGALFVFIVPLVLAQVSLRAKFPWYQDWTDFVYLFIFFTCGYLILAEPRFQAILFRYGPSTLGLALVLGAVFLILMTPGWFIRWEQYPGYAPGYVAYQLIRTMLVWATLVFLLYVGIRFLNFRNRFLDYASEAVMPFYVLHHPVIVIIGFYVIQWSTNLWVKHVVITVTALALTLAIYEIGVRHFAATRWLFGMRPLAKSHRIQHGGARSRPPVPLEPVEVGA